MALDLHTVRKADIEGVLVLARAMHAESPRFQGRHFSEEKARHIINLMIATYGGYVAYIDDQIVGMVGGIIAEDFFGTDKFCSDLVVYVTPEHRGSSVFIRLVRLFEEWAFKNGAENVLLGVSTGINREATVRVYERLGYTMTSCTLIKSRAKLCATPKR